MRHLIHLQLRAGPSCFHAGHASEAEPLAAAANPNAPARGTVGLSHSQFLLQYLLWPDPLCAPGPSSNKSSMSGTLQRLRQGQGRCQQLLSLSNWHEQAMGAAQQQARGLADQAAAVAFSKQRKGFQSSLSELRKQWAKERQEKEEARAAAELAERCGGRAGKNSTSQPGCCLPCPVARRAATRHVSCFWQSILGGAACSCWYWGCRHAAALQSTVDFVHSLAGRHVRPPRRSERSRTLQPRQRGWQPIRSSRLGRRKLG